MDIAKLAKKPRLEKLEITDADIVKTYGDTITFYMMDQMDISTYFNFYKLQQNESSELLNELLRKLILNQEGKPVLAEDEVFPVNITLAILVRINDFLGKSEAQTTSIQETGALQN
jgi:hypothetical protein